jgi:trigger factor
MPTATEMKVTREDLNPCTIKLDVVCTPDQVKTGFDRAYKAFAKQIRVPGFRPGTAPRSMIDKSVRAEDLNGAAAEEIVAASLKEILASEKIQPHDSPSVNLTKLEKDEMSCEYTAKVPLKPVVELGDYKGLTAERPSDEVTDTEVDSYLEELRKRAGRREVVLDRGAEDGDIAVVNVRKDGEDGDGKNFMATVGQTFAEMDKALAGMRSEEMKIETLKFPADFFDKDLAGKSAKVKIAIKTLSSVALPELDDAFAQGLEKDLKSLKAESLKDLKATLKQRLIDTRQQMAQEFVNESLQEELLRRSTVHVPDTMWENVANQRLNELQNEMRQQNKTLEDYAKSNGMTFEEMVASWQKEAKTQVQRAVVAREIFIKERLQLTNDDMNQALVQMAYEYQIAPAQLVEIMQKNKSFQELEIRGIFRKVIEFLNANAEIAAAGATPAKPKAAKAKKAEDEESAAPVEKTKKTAKKKAD